ncbi:hypothetical protein JRC61_05770 [Streptomyces sp. CL12-4]|nr:hypothetical protein [Streptomyces sp. CL12-4]
MTRNSRTAPTQFGIFTVGDVTPHPTTGRTPTERERIKAMVAIALKAEEVGLDVFATDLLGEEVVPVLREEFAKNRPANVPDAPTHASLLASAKNAEQEGARA